MIICRNIAEDEFSSDREAADIKLDDDEDLLSYDHQSNESNAEDKQNQIPLSVRIQLQPPGPAQSETTTTLSESTFAPTSTEPAHAPEMTQSNAISSPEPSHQIEHLGQCELSHDEPIQVLATTQMDSSTETGKRKQKPRTFDLNMFICGIEVSEAEIEEDGTVMQCKVPGCETEWVCKPHLTFSCLLTSLFLQSVPSCMYDI
jgi:hypothetical protein